MSVQCQLLLRPSPPPPCKKSNLAKSQILQKVKSCKKSNALIFPRMSGLRCGGDGVASDGGVGVKIFQP